MEVYHSHGGNEQWGLVCHYGWKKENGEVVCRAIGCGNHIDSGIERTFYRDPPLPQQYWKDQVECTSKEESLWKCPVVGAHIANCRSDLSFVAVQCSGNVTLGLNLNGLHDRCAGVVEFSTPNGIIGVCNDNWDKSIASKICQELGCGDHHYIPKPGMFKRQLSKHNVLLNCVGNESFTWQCMERSDCQERASVVCSNYKRLGLRDGSNACSGLVEEYSFENNSWNLKQTDGMSPEVLCTELNCGSTGNFTNANGTNRLTCSDSVKLRNFATKCFGDISIDVNGDEFGVCYSDSTLSHKKGVVVCQEFGCGEVVHVQKGSLIYNGLLSNVVCQGNEGSLWHCLAIHDKRKTKQCTGTKVKCSDSLNLRLRDGLGNCSGRVEVQWWGSWRSIGSDQSPINSDVVCQHLNCGAPTQITRELFVEGKQQQLESSWDFNCKSSSAKLHECFGKTPLRPLIQKKNSIEIICKKEELMFFEGDVPCQGRVRIERFDGETSWLPAEPKEENKQKASNLCQVMHCGSLDSFENEQNTTHANVKCLGSVSVALRNPLAEKCWGMVEVCIDDKCGGICTDTWRSNEDSKMICENLGCGEPFQGQLTLKKNYLSVSFYSVYCSENMRNMSMCRFIHNKDSDCNTAAQVICTDSIKARLEDPRDKCAGKVSLFYKGQWTPVCQDSKNEDLKNTICRELNCGGNLQGTDHLSLPFHDQSQIQGLSSIKCLNRANSVSKCDLSEASLKSSCTVMYLKCTDWERLLLYKMEGKCSGPVYGLSKEGKTPQLVRGQGWGREEGQKLCEYLQCGNYTSHSTLDIPIETTEWWNKTYNCSGKKSMWECESQDQPIQLQQLNIQCDRIPPAITLSDNCTGEVLIDKNHVCASQWHDHMSQELCHSLGCGKAIRGLSTKTGKKNCWHFSCSGMETSVWQCGSKIESCENILSVDCQNGVEFRTTEKCGGKLGIRYKGKWEYVCGELTKADAKKVCDVLKCENSQLLDEQEIAMHIKLNIICPEMHQSISQCVQHLQKDECRPAEIKCEGYTPKQRNSSLGLILGLLGGVLGLLILFLMWTKRKRLLLALRHYRNKNGKYVNPDVNEMDKMDTEDRDLSEGKASFLDDDDYEHVDSLMDKSGEEDEDDRKRGSSGTEYDDIDGQANGISPQTLHDDDLNLPVLPKRPENILDQDTYEVEIEKQEDYDDVIPVEAGTNENAGTTGTQAHVDVDVDEGLVANADAVFLTTEVEVHTQLE
ncbi:scavenger receptor cysteine-rich type 1 protein M160 [Onychostoma macrolepis]|nr:scavenger receptor cysteine-rich type 1 protein M160 [Onychostoma macrolepis]XP_058641430.1 scavenger receptor cysteine-rich type 1 protein M160 [Onychostoma macrolepis]